MTTTHKTPDTEHQTATEHLSRFERLMQFAKKHTKAVGAGAIALAAGTTTAFVAGLGPQGSEHATPVPSRTVATGPATPGVSLETPESSPTASPAPSETAPVNEKEAIKEALKFSEGPLSDRQEVLSNAAKEAYTATDGIFMTVFSERAGESGAVLAAYNQWHNPPTKEDDAGKILGNRFFGLVLAINQPSSSDPNKRDVAQGIRILSGLYYDPKHSADFKERAGLTHSTFGLMNDKSPLGSRIDSGRLADIAFDEELAEELKTIGDIKDKAGNPLPLRVVTYKAFEGASTVRASIFVFVGGQWENVDTASTNPDKEKDFWSEAVANYKKIVQEQKK